MMLNLFNKEVEKKIKFFLKKVYEIEILIILK
jgi:hypothetical protein